MATIWYRSTVRENWKTNPNWRGRDPEKAHKTADRYNRKHDSMYWVTDGERPDHGNVPEGKSND